MASAKGDKYVELSNWFSWTENHDRSISKWHRRYLAIGGNYLCARLWFTRFGVEVLWNAPMANSLDFEYGVRFTFNFSKPKILPGQAMYGYVDSFATFRRENEEMKSFKNYRIALLEARLFIEGQMQAMALPVYSDGRTTIGIDPNERAMRVACP